MTATPSTTSKRSASGQIVLFNLINRLRTSGGRLLAAADAPPLRLALREDLRTRLGSGLVYRLQPLSDAEKLAALAEQARARGLVLPPEVFSYLFSRAPRDMRSLTRCCAIDRYSLEQQRPITLPLLREVLQTSLTQT
jgi:DnaA family protein